MDTLIELIVRGLIALFSGSSDSQRPQTPRSVPKIPPIREAPAQRPVGAQQPIDNKLALRRQEAVRQQMMRAQKMRQSQKRQPAMKRGNLKQKAPPPPLPRPAAYAAPAPKRTQVAAPPPPSSGGRSGVSASGIRQLLRSRPAALRTIFALSEVVGRPVALREE
jgi:hypothetical protein